MDILNLEEHIRIMEELLLHQDFSNSPQALEAMLAEGFREINPDGKLVAREAVIAWLLAKDPASRWEYNDFEVRQLAPDLAQATYHARQVHPDRPSSPGALHCSLWQEKADSKTWQLIFHQSTRVS